MAIMKREQGNMSYDRPSYVNKDGEEVKLVMAKKVIEYLLLNRGDAIVSFPGLSHDREKGDDPFPMHRYKDTEWTDEKIDEVKGIFSQWNKNNLLKYTREPGWVAKINDRGIGHEYDHFLLTWSNNESKNILKDDDIKWRVMEAVNRVVSSSWVGNTGVKHSFVQAHEDSANFHIHIVGHRHAVDIDKQRIGPSEIPTKGNTPTTDLMNAINLEIERELNDESLFEVIRLRDCLDESGASLFGDRIRAQSLAAQQEASEAIERAGGINTKVPGKIDYTETIHGKTADSLAAELAQALDSARRKLEDLTAQRLQIDREEGALASEITSLQKAIGVLQVEEDRKKEIAQLQSDLEETKTELNTANENLLTTMDRAEQLVATQMALQEEMANEIAKRDDFINALEGDITELKGDKEELAGNLAKLEEAQALLNAELETAREEAAMAMDDVANLTDKLTMQTAAMQAMTDERDKALAETKGLRLENEDINKKLDEARAQTSTLANTVSEQNKQLGELTKQRDEAQTSVTRLNDQVREIQATSERTIAQLRSTHEQAMATQKAELEAAQTRALEAQKAELTESKDFEIEIVKTELESAHEQAMAAQKAEMQSAHEAAMASLRQELTQAHEAAMASLREEMTSAHTATITDIRQEMTTAHQMENEKMQQELAKVRDELTQANSRHAQELDAATKAAEAAKNEMAMTITNLQNSLASTNQILVSTREENERLTIELEAANKANAKMEGQIESMQTRMDEQQSRTEKMFEQMMKRMETSVQEPTRTAHLHAVLKQITFRGASKPERENDPDMLGYNRDGDLILARTDSDGRVQAYIVMDKEGQLVTSDGNKQTVSEMAAKTKARLKEESGKIHDVEDPERERE